MGRYHISTTNGIDSNVDLKWTYVGRMIEMRFVGEGEVLVSDKDLRSARRLFGAVLFGVCLGGFAGVMRCEQKVGVGGVRVMRGFFVSTGLVMFRGFLVMACRVFVMLRRFPMMLGCLLGHQGLLWCESS